MALSDLNDAEHALAQTLAEAARLVGRRLHTEILNDLDTAHIAQQTANALVIVASSMTDRLELSRNTFRDGCGLVVVQGTEIERVSAAADVPRSANS